MTEKELSEIHYINKEISKLKEEQVRLKTKSYIRGQELTGMPHSGEISDPTGELACLIRENEELIELSIKKIFIIRNKIERYLYEIDDSLIRLIIRLRCINNMSWDDIGKDIGYDRTTISKKFYKFLKDSHKSH